jgi:hypothetical protein
MARTALTVQTAKTPFEAISAGGADFTLAAGDYAAFTVGMTNDKGWKQSGGVIHVDTNNADIKLAVLRLP